jgi:hypothetical protein
MRVVRKIGWVLVFCWALFGLATHYASQEQLTAVALFGQTAVCVLTRNHTPGCVPIDLLWRNR